MPSNVSNSKLKVDEAVTGLIQAMADAARHNGDTNSDDSNASWVDETLGTVRNGVLGILRRRALVGRLRPELREKIVNWLISFHRLDPRYKILTFFNLVASDGADNFVNEEDDDLVTDDPMQHMGRRNFTRAEQLLRDAFNTTSILTVWRPCSNMAMRKMMEGSGVGKGLDIKGKSAQEGELSGFVPFLQIHEEDHKAAVTKIGRKAKMRVYYSSREAREAVMDELEPFGNDYMEFDAHKVIPSTMLEIDRYVHKGYYGIELHQRLFWHGYVMHQNIERGPDTTTGRPSMPGFQDANLKTLKVATDARPLPDPMPVVFQYNKTNHMSPQHLLMAYEEDGAVTPVVSDFDGFLLGWRREALWFGCNLPREQEDLMLWCVDKIEEILDSPPSSDTWTMRWLEVLKQDNPNPEIPPYGFGDPKSYGIMERAAMQLIDTGAVRHGAESFNYYFPQEIDETLLIISDTLKPVPWMYVNVKQLQSILSQRIWDGFVFPINPKWILCDPGWKRLYDQLLASDALYAEYTKEVWYPPFSGIRDKIDKIAAKHPKGFQRRRVDPAKKSKQDDDNKAPYSPLRRNLETKMSGNAAFDLAELELAHFERRKRHCHANLADSVSELQENLADLDLSSDED